MTNELVLSETARYETMHEVVTLHLEGRNKSQIAKALKLRIVDVEDFINEFKQIARDDDLLRARSKEVVHEFDQQMNRINTNLWEVADEAEQSGDLKMRATALKSLADISAKRVEVLQKSGLLSDAALGDEMAELEDRQEQLINILKEVTSKCDHCKFEVSRRLTDITGKIEPVVVKSVR